MLSRLARSLLGAQRGRCSAHSSRSSHLKVAILGADTYTGKTAALCLKQSQLVDELSVWPGKGLQLELSHMDTRCKTYYEDAVDGLDPRATLAGARIVLFAQDKKHLVKESAALRRLAPHLIRHCPKALVGLMAPSNNSLLPMLFELYKMHGIFDCNRLFGLMSLQGTRANNIAAETLKLDPEFVSVPLVGGCTTDTCVPLFSQTKPCSDFSLEELAKMALMTRNAESQVVGAYSGSRLCAASCLCAGFSAARFCVSLCRAIRAEQGIVECAYTRSCLVPEVKYFGGPLELGPAGIQKHLGVPKLAKHECSILHEGLESIRRAISVGEVMATGREDLLESCSGRRGCGSVPGPAQPRIDAA